MPIFLALPMAAAPWVYAVGAGVLAAGYTLATDENNARSTGQAINNAWQGVSTVFNGGVHNGGSDAPPLDGRATLFPPTQISPSTLDFGTLLPTEGLRSPASPPQGRRNTPGIPADGQLTTRTAAFPPPRAAFAKPPQASQAQIAAAQVRRIQHETDTANAQRQTTQLTADAARDTIRTLLLNQQHFNPTEAQAIQALLLGYINRQEQKQPPHPRQAQAATWVAQLSTPGPQASEVIGKLKALVSVSLDNHVTPDDMLKSPPGLGPNDAQGLTATRPTITTKPSPVPVTPPPPLGGFGDGPSSVDIPRQLSSQEANPSVSNTTEDILTIEGPTQEQINERGEIGFRRMQEVPGMENIHLHKVPYSQPLFPTSLPPGVPESAVREIAIYKKITPEAARAIAQQALEKLHDPSKFQLLTVAEPRKIKLATGNRLHYLYYVVPKQQPESASAGSVTSAARPLATVATAQAVRQLTLQEQEEIANLEQTIVQLKMGMSHLSERITTAEEKMSRSRIREERAEIRQQIKSLQAEVRNADNQITICINKIKWIREFGNNPVENGTGSRRDRNSNRGARLVP
jgi:hypothetical protein